MNRSKVTHQDQRKRRRFPFQTEVCVTVSDSIQMKGELDNISMSGLFVLTDMKPKTDTECDVDIRLFDRGNRISFSVKGRVVRQDSDGIGIEFFNELELWCLGCALSWNSNVDHISTVCEPLTENLMMAA